MLDQGKRPTNPMPASLVSLVAADNAIGHPLPPPPDRPGGTAGDNGSSKACANAAFGGARVTVGTIVGLIASDCGTEEILRDYRYIDADDIQASLFQAGWRSEEGDVPRGSA
jgi:hypothetical protein